MAEKSPLPLGLTLRKTPSLLDLVSRLISPTVARAPVPDKRSAANEGEIVAKFYYAKRRLIWEILERGLMNKMEIQWGDVTGLHASLSEGTEHTLRFACGVLNKHFERLMKYDERLRSISTLQTLNPDQATDHQQMPLALQEQSRPLSQVQFSDSRDVSPDQSLACAVMNLPCIDENQAMAMMDNRTMMNSGASCWSDYDFAASATALSDFLVEDHVAGTSRQSSNPQVHQSPTKAWLGEADLESFMMCPTDQDHFVPDQNQTYSPANPLTTQAAAAAAVEANFPHPQMPPEEVSVISRKFSAGDLLVNLPRVASLPEFFNVL
ncbi:uncharacterized protein LOC9648013 [Selaginella moellendorffii]|uniref:uncharacterized protein LOC9648013 n=1 Tax=Selaginella moellendorffii TaxID=88036 RepID=UPI000D1C6D23|nr:uncharacterized protein LOC9648013 [Selaginella moellendorffii]|eukprot:XP_024519809.1 uncharacterized protein LOC9648013 [Selaginella moellendorffii]